MAPVAEDDHGSPKAIVQSMMPVGEGDHVGPKAIMQKAVPSNVQQTIDAQARPIAPEHS
jgi:hypothetical protein